MRPRPALEGRAGEVLDGGGQGQNRTADTAVFSRVLCQLSYLAVAGRGPDAVSRG